MDEPLRAHTFNEVRYYLMVRPCPTCGKGPWEADSPPPAPQVSATCLTEAHCTHCDDRRPVAFVLVDNADDDDVINTADQPSEIVDLAQWLSLFYMLIESAAAKPAGPESRHIGYRAALCLAEALKFYEDDELPGEGAFFSDETASAFRQHPANFARQRLRDMQAKLPALGAMASHVDRDRQVRGRRWWQFWKRRS